MPRLSLTVIALIGAAVLALVALKSCGWSFQQAQQGKQDTRSANALAETAKDAAATAIAQADEEATVDELVAAATEEIENAPNVQAADAAARAAICELPDFRSDPACRVQ